MKALLKEYQVTENYEYFDIVADSFINGQKKQALTQFDAMPKDNQVECLNYFDSSGYSYLNTHVIQHVLHNR